MPRTAVIIHPSDQGRQMTLDDFEFAERSDDRMYELSRGVIQMVDVPDEPHGAILEFLRDELALYRRAHKGMVHRILPGDGCKIVVASDESERHPDLAFYKSARPDVENYWREWIPEIVIEVVSQSSVYRDYEEKPPEYLAFGVAEYWIVDPLKQQITFNRRTAGVWKPQVCKPGEKYATHVLPGFELDVAAILATGK